MDLVNCLSHPLFCLRISEIQLCSCLWLNFEKIPLFLWWREVESFTFGGSGGIICWRSADETHRIGWQPNQGRDTRRARCHRKILREPEHQVRQRWCSEQLMQRLYTKLSVSSCPYPTRLKNTSISDTTIQESLLSCTPASSCPAVKKLLRFTVSDFPICL